MCAKSARVKSDTQSWRVTEYMYLECTFSTHFEQLYFSKIKGEHWNIEPLDFSFMLYDIKKR